MSIFLAALTYSQFGLRCFPIKSGMKEPPLIQAWQLAATTDPEQLHDWAKKWPNANVGIATGEDSNLFVFDIDVDITKGIDGRTSLAQLEARHQALPSTVSVVTPRGGRHDYFKFPQGYDLRNTVGTLGPGLDTRGNGGYILAPPSLHPNGLEYTYIESHSFNETTFAELPPWLLELLIQPQKKASPSTFNENGNRKVLEGRRNSHLTQLGGFLRAKGMGGAVIEAALLVENRTNCLPPLEASEVQIIANSMSRYEPGRLESDQGLIKEVTDQILSNNYFANDPGGFLCHYEKGCYRPSGKHFIAREFLRILEKERRTKKWSIHKSREVTAYIAIQSPRLWDVPPLHIVNLQNGIFDLAKHELLPHTPTHLSSVQLPVEYDPNAAGEAWEVFLGDVLSEDCHHIFWQIVGYLMTPDMGQQKAFLFHGDGGNGKSTAITGLSKFLGEENTSALSLQKIGEDRFATAGLVGKLANFFADLPAEHLASSSTFKAITGGDRLSAERKFKESFNFQPFCRLLFSANHFPECRESSSAFFRRWIILPFERTFSEHRSNWLDPKILAARLSSPNEKSVLLNKAVAAVGTLRTIGRFSDSETTKGAWMEFLNQTDPIAQWLESSTESEPSAFITRKDLTINIRAWMEKHKRPNLDQKSICASIRRLRPNAIESQKRINGKMERVFLGICWKKE